MARTGDTGRVSGWSLNITCVVSVSQLMRALSNVSSLIVVNIEEELKPIRLSVL